MLQMKTNMIQENNHLKKHSPLRNVLEPKTRKKTLRPFCQKVKSPHARIGYIQPIPDAAAHTRISHNGL